VLLLNNDTVVDPEFLGELVNVSERDPKIGIAGPKIYYYEYKGNKNIVWSRGGKINWWFPLHYHSGFRNVGNDIEKDKIQNVDYIPGTCILIKTEILEYITLPTDYFMQYEDLDFCQQVMKMNYSCVYVPTSKIWHKISASYKKPKLKCFQMKMSFRNSIIFYNKFVSKQRFVIIVLGLILIKLPIIVSYQIFKAKNRSALNCALEGMKEGVMAVMKK
jgi:GT2 family glycosyltransferase